MSSRGLFLTLVLATVLPAHAEDWTTTKKACHDAHFFHHVQVHNAEECVVDTFTLDPIGPAIGTIATGSGFGGGFHFVHKPDSQHSLTVKGLYTFNSSFTFGAQYQLDFRGRTIITGKRPDGRGGDKQTLQGNLFFTASHLDLHSQDFYGIGPASSLAGHAVYRLHETWAGASGYAPIASAGNLLGIFGLSGQIKFVHPATGGVNGDSLPSVVTLYGEAGAPSATRNPNFVVAGVGLDLRDPEAVPRVWERHRAQLTYAHYAEAGGSRFSFDRLEAYLSALFKLSMRLPPPSPHQNLLDQPERSWWQNALCMPSQKAHCDIGSFTTTTVLTTSYTGPGSSVPFYFQPTLGGTDFDGLDTLRGLVDYRLRAPNRLLTQVGFDKPVANLNIIKKGQKYPIGQYGLYAFLDAGNVALTPSQLFSNGLRTDVGVGFSFALQHKLIFRAWMAFGAGEGAHPNAKAANTFGGAPQVLGSWTP
jgi:hypothetical protein